MIKEKEHFEYSEFTVYRTGEKGITEKDAFPNFPSPNSALPKPDDPYQVQNYDISCVLEGSVFIKNKNCPGGGKTWYGGHDIDDWRYKKRSIIIPNSEKPAKWLCITPKKPQFWNREFVEIKKDEKREIPKNSKKQYLFVVYGTVKFQTAYNINDMIEISENVQVELTALSYSKLIRIYKKEC